MLLVRFLPMVAVIYLAQSLASKKYVPAGSGTLATTSPLFVGFLIGMGSGVNVRVAHALGAGKHKDTVETVHTALLLCMMMGLLIGAVCFFFSGRMLMLLHTKDDLIDMIKIIGKDE